MSYEEYNSSDSYEIDLFEGKSSKENGSKVLDEKLTEKYLDGTIGDIIGELLEQTSKDAPPDPILHLANLLERYCSYFHVPVFISASSIHFFSPT